MSVIERNERHQLLSAYAEGLPIVIALEIADLQHGGAVGWP